MFFEKIHSRLLEFKKRNSPRFPFGKVNWGSLRKLAPVSRKFGLDRGRAIDRYYIENFLLKNCQDVRGRVLEIGGSHYTKLFGNGNQVISDVLHAVPGNPQATLVGDLATGEGIPQGAFDCMILTQTFPFIYDIHSAIGHAHAALKPGGVLLATLSGISQISRYDMDRWGDYWRFTTASATRLFEGVFGSGNVSVESFGNVFVACAFLQGMAVEELTQEELDYHDPDYQVTIVVRAVRTWDKE